jgi:glycosyltransferase involved in cell wall biosynthesis
VLIVRPSAADQGGVSGFYEKVTDHLRDGGIDLDYLEVGSARGRRLHPVADQLAFTQRIIRRQYDLINVNPSLVLKSFLRDGLFIWQAKMRGFPVLVFFRGWSDEFAEDVQRRWSWFFRQTYARADSFIVLGSDFERKLREWGILAPIYRGTTAVDEELLSGFDFEAKLVRRQQDVEHRVLFLARLEPEKGIYETIDACALLNGRGICVRLVVAGEGSEAEKIRRYGAEQLGNQVQFTGYVRAAAKVAAFSAADVYAMPTYYDEGMPNSLLEAMAFGLPAVTRPVGGIKDFFIDRQHGLITDSKDPEVIATLLEELLTNRNLWLQTSRGARDYAMERFVSSAVAKNLIRIYREVTGFVPRSDSESGEEG